MGLFHAETLVGRVPSAELVRVVDTDEALARSTGERLGVAWGTEYGELLADPAVDGVVVATPTTLHVEMVEQSAQAGKHVFCEKPISYDLDSTLAAIEAAREGGIALQVGFHRRFDPDWVAAASRIKAGELGQIYLFRTTLRDKEPPPVGYLGGSGGFFVDTSIHDLDTARWFAGEIDSVTAFGAALSDPIAAADDIDNVAIVLQFASGALGLIDESRVAGYGYECTTEVVGSQATVRIDDHRRVNNVWLTPGSATVDWVADFTERFPQAYALELESFALAVRDQRPPEVTGEDGLAAFVLAQACDRSFREQQTVRLRHEERVGHVIYEAA
jgi:predicted dehydrogenase